MDIVNLTPPSGTRDFLPADVKLREGVFAAIKQVFESFGFVPLETPAFERIEILNGKYGKEEERLIYKILKRGEQAVTGKADLALRYDFTVPLARVIARYQNKLPKIFKRYQIGPVWRADRPGKGRFREFYQADVDIIGTESRMADAEILLVLSESLTRLGLQKFVIRFNSRKVLVGLMEAWNVPTQLQANILTVLDKFDKIGDEGIKEELLKQGAPQKIIERIATFLEILPADSSGLIKVIKKILQTSPLGRLGLKEVEEVTSLVTPILKGGRIIFFPLLARGLAYYTGPIFEIYTERLTTSIASGGRYDNLIGIFVGKSIPACGGSLGIERILLSLKEQKAEKIPTFTQVLVTVWDKDFQEDALCFAAKIRNSGLSAETYLGKDKISQQLRYASNKGIPFVVLFGPDEKSKKKVTIKNLQTGLQAMLSQDEFVGFLQKNLNSGR